MKSSEPLMVNVQQEETKLPTAPELCLEIPLYKSFSFDPESDYKKLISINHFQGNVDCYCLKCGKESVFHAIAKVDLIDFLKKPINIIKNEVTKDGTFIIEFFCSRIGLHRLYFIFYIGENKIIKIGQNPSMADLAATEIQKYRKILSKELFAEFNRAIGLVSHGIGIGDFVYFRRIFEGLISEAHDIAKSEGRLDEEIYGRSRMDEKIGLLKDHLPAFLVENKNIYSILSKGIHELSEEECLKFFPVIKTGIELILDEKISQKEKQDKTEKAKKALADLHTTLK